MNKPLTPLDIRELERMLDEASEIGGKATFNHAFGRETSLGSLIRGLVGLDESAAQAAFAEFLKDGGYNATQIHFVNQVIAYLTSEGLMDPRLLFDSPPFTDSHSSGVAGVFPIEEARRIVNRLKQINANAAGAGDLGESVG